MQHPRGGVPAAAPAAELAARARRTRPMPPESAQPSPAAGASVPRPLQPEKGLHGPSEALRGRAARHAAATLRRHHDLRKAAERGGLRRG